MPIPRRLSLLTLMAVVAVFRSLCPRASAQTAGIARPLWTSTGVDYTKRRPNPMRALNRLAFLTLLLPAFVFGQEPHNSRGAGSPARSPLEATISRFDVTDAILRDGLSELSLKNIEDLHLGFEGIIRERIQDDPRVQSPHFSLHLQGKTVREVLHTLCSSDARYAWSEDGATINIYPRATADDPSYLLNCGSINCSSVASRIRIRPSLHSRKGSPNSRSAILVQAWDITHTQSRGPRFSRA